MSIISTTSNQGSDLVVNNTQQTKTNPEQAQTLENIATKADQIADAAVYVVSSQLNSSGTQFESGVRDNVRSAVFSALQKQASQHDLNDKSEQTIPQFSGGKYQNEIMYGKKNEPPVVSLPPTPPPQDIPSDVPPPVVEPAPKPKEFRPKSHRSNRGGSAEADENRSTRSLISQRRHLSKA